MTLADNTVYEGNWKNDLRDGDGIEIDDTGKTYTGLWLNGVKHGQGVYTFANGRK